MTTQFLLSVVVPIVVGVAINVITELFKRWLDSKDDNQ